MKKILLVIAALLLIGCTASTPELLINDPFKTIEVVIISTQNNLKAQSLDPQNLSQGAIGAIAGEIKKELIASEKSWFASKLRIPYESRKFGEDIASEIAKELREEKSFKFTEITTITQAKPEFDLAAKLKSSKTDMLITINVSHSLVLNLSALEVNSKISFYNRNNKKPLYEISAITQSSPFGEPHPGRQNTKRRKTANDRTEEIASINQQFEEKLKANPENFEELNRWKNYEITMSNSTNTVRREIKNPIHNLLKNDEDLLTSTLLEQKVATSQLVIATLQDVTGSAKESRQATKLAMAHGFNGELESKVDGYILKDFSDEKRIIFRLQYNGWDRPLSYTDEIFSIPTPIRKIQARGSLVTDVE